MDAKPKRRWSRFSLRTLLVLVTVASAGFGWVGYKVRQAQRQKQAVVAIEELGGYVRYDYEFDNHGDWTESAIPPDPEWLRVLLGVDFLADVFDVEFTAREVTDADLVHLRGLRELKRLHLGRTLVTDGGLEELQKAFPNLKIYQWPHP